MFRRLFRFLRQSEDDGKSVVRAPGNVAIRTDDPESVEVLTGASEIVNSDWYAARSIGGQGGDSIPDTGDESNPESAVSPQPSTPSEPEPTDEDATAPDTPSVDPHPSTPSEPEPEPSDGGTVSPDTPAVEPLEPGKATPPALPEPVEEIERGTFALPANRHFLQTMTAAGKNGAHPRVETGYIITGATYAVPNVVFALDDPKWFPKATETSLATLTNKVAKAVAKAYPDEYTPSLVVWVHTHPNGGTKPSATDKKGSESVQRTFKQQLGTDDFEFFNAVHGYDEISVPETISERFVPSNMTSGFEWTGDTHEHRMSLWDADFTTPAPTTVITDE